MLRVGQLEPQGNEWDARVAGVRRFAEAGNLDGLVRSLYGLNVDLDGDWAGDGGGQVIELLGRMPIPDRVQLLCRMTEGLEETAVHAPRERPGLARLVVRLSEGLSCEQLAAWREPLLDLAAGMMTLWEGWRLGCLAEVELAAGRCLPDAVVATVRRTALAAETPGELLDVAAGIAEPPLNPGEPWADRALADLAVTGPAWHPLIGHALSLSGSRPGVGWQRAGRQLLAELGPERVRSAVCGWLALAGEPRSLPVASYYGSGTAGFEMDPFNVRALQGVAALLALAPAHPDSAAALGRLVEAALLRIPGVGPRSHKTASAAVHALVQLGDEDAYDELERLAGTVKYRPTVNLVTKALAARTV